MTIITAEAAVLGRALKDVAAIITRTETIPVLSNILIETVGEDAIRLTGTDLSKRIARMVPAKVGEAGAFTVEASRFASVVSSFAGECRMATAENGIAVTSGRSRFRFATLPADQYPPEKAEDTIASFTADGRFIKALAITRHAHGTNATQAWQQGALLTDRGGLEVVGLDGVRMAIANLGGAGVANAIIPSPAVDLILKMASGEFGVQLTANRIRCDFGQTVLTAKLIDGTYADYARVIPVGEMPRSATLSGDDLRAALGRIALMADDKDRKTRLSFEADKLTITLDTNLDQAIEEVACAFIGEPFQIGFRSQFLRDALTAMDADDVTLGMAEPRMPMRLTAEQRPGMTLIVMPVEI